MEKENQLEDFTNNEDDTDNNRVTVIVRNSGELNATIEEKDSNYEKDSNLSKEIENVFSQKHFDVLNSDNIRMK